MVLKCHALGQIRVTPSPSLSAVQGVAAHWATTDTKIHDVRLELLTNVHRIHLEESFCSHFVIRCKIRIGKMK
jgi:hypothetical protein